jgi:hypothetical protein
VTPLVTGLMPHQIAKCQTRGPRLPLLKGSPTVEVLKKPATWFCLDITQTKFKAEDDTFLDMLQHEYSSGVCLPSTN